jgi:hypothetical protein
MWGNNTNTAPVGFYKDQFGVVHLQGGVDPPGFSGTIFTLPQGYRPGAGSAHRFAVEGDAGLTAIEIRPNGDVVALSSQSTMTLLEGVTFRAEQ